MSVRDQLPEVVHTCTQSHLICEMTHCVTQSLTHLLYTHLVSIVCILLPLRTLIRLMEGFVYLVLMVSVLHCSSVRWIEPSALCSG